MREGRGGREEGREDGREKGREEGRERNRREEERKVEGWGEERKSIDYAERVVCDDGIEIEAPRTSDKDLS